jgi:hypothetical protein
MFSNREGSCALTGSQSRATLERQLASYFQCRALSANIYGTRSYVNLTLTWAKESKSVMAWGIVTWHELNCFEYKVACFPRLLLVLQPQFSSVQISS